MKKHILLIAFLITTTIGTSQEVYIEAGKTVSSFDYENSQGQSLDNLQSTNHNFMSLGYRKQFLNENVHWSVGTSFSSYGAIGSDNSSGNFMEWNMNFLEFNSGIDYTFYSLENFSFYVKGITSIKFLTQGTQTINNMVYELKDSDVFKKTTLDFRMGIGFSHPVSDNLSFYAQYIYGKSLNIAKSNEQLKIVSNQLGFGFLIRLSNKKTDTNNTVKQEQQ